MKLSEFVNIALIRAGIEINVDNLPDVELPTDSETKANSLMNMNLAKSNNDLQAHFFQKFAKQTETKIAQIINETGIEVKLTDDNGQPLKMNEQVAAVLAAAENKAKGAGKKVAEKEDELQAKIAELNKRLSDSAFEFETKTKQIHQEYSQKAINHKLQLALAGFEYKKDIPEEDRFDLANMRLQKKLNELGAQLHEDNGKIVLVKQNEPDSKIFDANGKPLDFSELLKTTVAPLTVEGKTIQAAPPKVTAPPPPTTSKIANVNIPKYKD